MADPLWRDLLKHSNEGKYGEFVGKFARSLALAMNEVVANHQFANSELQGASPKMPTISASSAGASM